MNYFICALNSIQLGIPAERAERIIPVTRMQTAVYETENQEAFISLPALFRQEDTPVPHGVVLKPNGLPDGTVKAVLLTPRIEKDLEIPEEGIHGLPAAFAGLFRYFSGACFNGQEIIFILNPIILMEKIR